MSLTSHSNCNLADLSYKTNILLDGHVFDYFLVQYGDPIRPGTYVSLGLVNSDLQYIRQQARENIRLYIHEKLPEEYGKCLTGLNSILKESWQLSSKTEDGREKIQALSLAKQCYDAKLDLLTNVDVVEDIIRFMQRTSG